MRRVAYLVSYVKKGQRRALGGMPKEHKAVCNGIDIRYPLGISRADR